MMKIEKRLAKLIQYYLTEPEVRNLIRQIDHCNFSYSKRVASLELLNLKYPDLNLTKNFNQIDWFATAIVNNQTFTSPRDLDKMFFQAGKQLGLNGLVKKLRERKNIFDFVILYNFKEFETFWNSEQEYADLFLNHENERVKLCGLYVFHEGLCGPNRKQKDFTCLENYLIYLAGYDLFLERKK